MANPVITTSSGGYTVSDSTRVHVDLSLTMTTGEALFSVTFPVAPAPTVFLDRGATIVPLTLPAPTGQSSSAVTGREVLWISSDNAATGTRTLNVRVQDSSFAATNEPWKLRIQGLPAATTLTVQNTANAPITQIEADPILVMDTPTQMKKENQQATLIARARRNYEPSPAATPCGSIPMVWTQDSGDPVSAVPGAPSTATAVVQGVNGCQSTSAFTLPAVSRTRTLHYTVTATAGAFTNSATATVTLTPRTRHTLLVLDRSGSMSGESWNNAVKAAHVWVDLHSAFRQGVDANDRIGIEVFEDSSGVYRPTGSMDPLIEVEYPSHGALGPLPVLPAPAAINVGAPGNYTPIGDGLLRALDRLVGQPGLPSENLYTLMLVTDGFENAGLTRVDVEPPPPFEPDIEIFNNVKNLGARNIFKFTAPNKNVQFYTLGVGPLGSVPEDTLNDLAYGDPEGPGLYQLVNTPAQLASAFSNMVAHNLGAATMPALALGSAAKFTIPANEGRVVVILILDLPTEAGSSMQLSWSPAGQNSWLPLGTPIHTRSTHVVASFDASAPPISGANVDIRVERLSGAAVVSTAANRVIAVRDLRVSSKVIFDQPRYHTGQPMKVRADLFAGGAPVTNAHVKVELAMPGESLGDFISVNSSSFNTQLVMTPQGVFQPPLKSDVGALLPGKYSDQNFGTHVIGNQADPLHPKPALLQAILEKRGLREIPMVVVNQIFTDGTDELWDDGAHGDGAAHDGVFANTFAKTTKEGTYTFRFTFIRTNPDGTQEMDTLILSRWVGIFVDPVLSVINGVLGLPAPQGLLAAQIFVLPMDSFRQRLGPFRSTAIQFKTTAGAFTGNIITHADGRYSRVLVYRPQDRPRVTINVQGPDLPPVIVTDKGIEHPGEGAQGCLTLLLRLLAALIDFLKKALGGRSET